MIDLKKKCWREKITAEITVAHVLQFAQEMGNTMNTAEVAAFLNERGRAQAVWTQMMQAGEAYLKANLAQNSSTRSVSTKRTEAAIPTQTSRAKFHPVSYQ